MDNLKNISIDTIIRTVVLAVTLVNSVLTMLGKNPLPFAQEDLYAVLSSVATVCATLWAWWKNNSFTCNAISADEYLTKLKSSDKR